MPEPDDFSPLYVYALVEPGIAVADDLVLVRSPRVAAVCEAVGLDALTGVGADEERLAEWARRHDSVVRAMAERDAVLPVRMGTISSRPRLTRALADAEDTLTAQLARLRDRHEWRLRFAPAATPAVAVESRARSGAPRESGTDYLLRRHTEFAAGGTGDDAFARADALLRDRGAEPGDLRWFGRTGRSRSYLLADRAVDELLAELEPVLAGTAADGGQLEFSGPLPAYSFADVHLGAAS